MFALMYMCIKAKYVAKQLIKIYTSKRIYLFNKKLKALFDDITIKIPTIKPILNVQSKNNECK